MMRDLDKYPEQREEKTRAQIRYILEAEKFHMNYCGQTPTTAMVLDGKSLHETKLYLQWNYNKVHIVERDRPTWIQQRLTRVNDNLYNSVELFRGSIQTKRTVRWLSQQHYDVFAFDLMGCGIPQLIKDNKKVYNNIIQIINTNGPCYCYFTNILKPHGDDISQIWKNIQLNGMKNLTERYEIVECNKKLNTVSRALNLLNYMYDKLDGSFAPEILIHQYGYGSRGDIIEKTGFGILPINNLNKHKLQIKVIRNSQLENNPLVNVKV